MALIGMCFVGCGEVAEKPEISEPINIGVLKGPTGMGMVELMEEEYYNITISESPDEVTTKLISGELDMAALPSNMGSLLYNKTGGEIQILGINTGGVLYIVEKGESTLVNSLADLKGKTLYASGQGATPEYMLKALMAKEGLSENDIDIVWLASHTDVISTLLTQDNGFAMLPEPHVSIALSKDTSLAVSLDLNSMWLNAYDSELPMGILAVRKAYADEHSMDIELFLEDYAESVKFVNENQAEASEKIAEYGIVPSAALALDAIPRCNIILVIDGAQVRQTMEILHQILFAYAPKSIGGALPDDGYYYFQTK